MLLEARAKKEHWKTGGRFSHEIKTHTLNHNQMHTHPLRSIRAHRVDGGRNLTTQYGPINASVKEAEHFPIQCSVTYHPSIYAGTCFRHEATNNVTES